MYYSKKYIIYLYAYNIFNSLFFYLRNIILNNYCIIYVFKIYKKKTINLLNMFYIFKFIYYNIFICIEYKNNNNLFLSSLHNFLKIMFIIY